MTNDWDSADPTPDGAPAQRVVDDGYRRTVLDSTNAAATWPGLMTEPQIDQLLDGSPSSFVPHGSLGALLATVADSGLGTISPDLLTGPFTTRVDKGGGFRGEFWGKWALAAVAALRVRPDKTLAERLIRSVEDVCASADAAGYIGTYPDDERLNVFDVWIAKYTAWGLLEYGSWAQDLRATVAGTALLRSLRENLEDRALALEQTGLDVLHGAGSLSLISVLASFSAVAPELDEFAKENIAASESDSGGIVHALMSGASPTQWPSMKAYELMSVLEGLLERAHRDRDASRLRRLLAAVDRILDEEITVVGSCSSQELFAHTRRSQTRPIPQPQETCVTVYWMRLCRQALRVSGDSRWAEALEVTLHNAMLAAVSPDGSWFSYFSPLEGAAEPSPRQFDEIPASCCVMNGFRGLFDLAAWIVDESSDVVRLNLLLDGQATTPRGRSIGVTGDFTRTGTAIVRIESAGAFVIRLRQPSWARGFRIQVNGADAESTAREGWVDIRNDWALGDEVTVSAQMDVRYVRMPFDHNVVAVARGPVVFALPESDSIAAGEFVWISPSHPASVSSSHGRTRVTVAVETRPSHYFGWAEGALTMAPFAELASLSQTSGSPYRVWLPQPWIVQGEQVRSDVD